MFRFSSRIRRLGESNVDCALLSAAPVYRLLFYLMAHFRHNLAKRIQVTCDVGCIRISHDSLCAHVIRNGIRSSSLSSPSSFVHIREVVREGVGDRDEHTPRLGQIVVQVFRNSHFLSAWKELQLNSEAELTIWFSTEWHNIFPLDVAACNRVSLELSHCFRI